MKIGCTDIGAKTVGTILNGAYVKEVSQLVIPHIATVQVLDNDTIDFPVVYNTSVGNYDMQIDWGDGVVEDYVGNFNPSDVQHTYTTAGSYDIKVTGEMPLFVVNNTTVFKSKITAFSFGTFQIKTLSFYQSENLSSVSGTPLFYSNPDLSNLFRDITTLSYIDLEGWDWEGLANMPQAFWNCSADFNPGYLPLNKINTSDLLFSNSGVTSVDFSNREINSYRFVQWFSNCSQLLTVNISNTTWTSTLNTFQSMFYNCTNLTTVNMDGCIINSSDLYGTFQNCTGLINISTQNIILQPNTRTERMFQGCAFTSFDFESFPFENVGNASFMFSGYKGITADLTNCDFTNITSLNNFINSAILQTIDLPLTGAPNCTTFRYMLVNSSELTTINNSSNLVGAAATDLFGMLANDRKVTTLDVSNWNTSNVTNWTITFSGMTGLTTLIGGETLSFSSAVLLDRTFASTKLNLTSTAGWTNSGTITVLNQFLNLTSSWTNPIDLTGFNVSNVTNFNSVFNGNKTTSLNVSNWNTSSGTNFISTFSNMNIVELDLSSFTVRGSLQSMFDTNLLMETLILPNGFINNQVTSIRETFDLCRSLTAINTTNIDLSGITDPYGLYLTFRQCYKLQSLDLGNNTLLPTISIAGAFGDLFECSYFNAPNLLSNGYTGSNALSSLFQNLGKDLVGTTTINIQNWNVEGVVDYYGMFSNTKIETLDLSGWTNFVPTTLANFLSGSSLLTSLNLSSCNFENITTLASFANGCYNLDITVTNWNLISINSGFNLMIGTSNFTLNTYEKLLIDLDTYLTATGFTLNAGISNYTCLSAAETAKNNLIANNGFAFTDGGCI